MRAGVWVLAGAAVLLAAAAAPGWSWHLPAGVAVPAVPRGNAMSDAKVALGRRLFYDADLSTDGSMSCSTCHEQHRAFADGNATHPGVHGDAGVRNVPGLANVALMRRLTWDGRAHSLEAQADIPVLGLTPVEMGMAGQEAEIARRLAADPCYARMFRDAFPESGGRIDQLAIGRALASFERTMISFDTPADHGALSAEAATGATLFRGQCAACHSGPLFSDGGFHTILPPGADHGLGAVTLRPRDMGRFRTPSLRNVALTAPYMHDGSARTLADAIAAHPGSRTSAQVAVLIAYLTALTDRGFVTDPALAYPDKVCGRPG